MIHRFSHDRNSHMIPDLPPEIVTTCQHDRAHVLHQSAREVEFPLSEEALDTIKTLKRLTTTVMYGAGLAAPQIGVDLRIIVYQVVPEALVIREDAREVVPLTVLINPTYTIIETGEKTFDWEFCFSVLDQGGKVWRPTSINYTGYTEDGTFIQGEAHGFLARLLQHEIDHVNGLLCNRLYEAGGVFGDRQKMFEIRQQEIEAKKKNLSKA